jgi:4-aminobutyrate aminotransferase-like enzyme
MNTRSPAAISAADTIAAQEEFLFPCVKPYYEKPLVLDEGHGVWVTDVDGREFLDFFGGILTTSIGHCHPEVVERVRDQLERLGHTSTLYVTEKQVSVARRLAELSPGALKKSFFTNSGTEAMETAVMLASMHTGRTEIVALRHSYSGRSILASNLGAQAPWRPLAGSIAGISHAMAPNPYRSPFNLPPEETAAAFARDLEEVIQTTTSGRPAALLVEPIQGVGGFVVPPPGYFQLAADIIHSFGGLFIADEVQTGFGRTGKWFGIENWDVEPDIMYMAKGIASGFPVGATITTDEIAASWTAKSISTFGGNPISMAAAEATLDVMVREDVPTRSLEHGARLRAYLEGLYQEYPWIGDVRGMGLMQAMELVRDRETKEPYPAAAKALLEAAKEEGLLLGISGIHANVMRFAPSMLITEAEMDEALERLGRACRRMPAR